MPDLPNLQPMTSFDPSQVALVHDPTHDAVWEWPGVTPEQWQQAASSHWFGGKKVVNWRGLFLEGWQPIDDTTPRLPLPDDCRP
jgi:hypothetical protein